MSMMGRRCGSLVDAIADAAEHGFVVVGAEYA
jgi:hypothetical protein